jgi:hypothetical protein
VNFINRVRLGLLVATIFFLTSTAFCQTSPRCQGTKDHPVQICFADPPLVPDHCRKEIALHFYVGVLPFDNGIQPAYYFTYQVSRGGRSESIENPLDSKFLLTSADPLTQIPDGVHIPLQGSEDLSVTVSVYAEGLDAVSLSSPTVHVNDSVLVTAIVVGISHYNSTSVPALLHPDDDAKSVDTFLHALFPGSIASASLLTSDTQNPALQPTVKNIFDAITLEKLDPHACSNDDWFIFYFSGHGVVGSNTEVVGNRGAVATHYLSTTLLDPANLDGTAIPIEELLHQIRRLPAGNKVVILDSCFSGSSKRFHMPPVETASGKQLPTQAGATGHSLKVAYVYHQRVVDPYEFETRNQRNGSGDLLTFKEISEQEEADSRRGLYLSAAFSDHEAEEGFEQYSGHDLAFTPSDDETDDEKPMGHGLYTFTFLWNLLTQLPKNSLLPDILRGRNPKPLSVGPCTIDFSAAHVLSAADIQRLQLNSKSTDHPREYQTPQVAGATQTALPTLPCTIQIQSDVSPTSNEQPH